jgi:GT2 family glycosyltransferase
VTHAVGAPGILARVERARIPSVSVVIPTRGRAERLPAVLAPLLADHATAEVVVVVDDDDDSFALLQALAARYDRVRTLRIPRSGAARARLAGVRQAYHDVVLLLDDDVLARPGLVTGHALRHAGRTGLVVVGHMPVALPERRGPGEFATHRYAREYERHCARWEADPESILTSLWAGNVSLRRGDWLRVAGDGADLVDGYHEDLDFGLRCRAAGLRGFFDRSLRAEHLYVRDPRAFARDARSSGASLVEVHHRHARVLGPLPDDFAARALPAPARQVASAAARRRGVEPLIRAARWLAGRLRLFRVESAIGHVLWSIGQAEGAASRLARGEVGDVTAPLPDDIREVLERR